MRGSLAYLSDKSKALLFFMTQLKIQMDEKIMQLA